MDIKKLFTAMASRLKNRNSETVPRETLAQIVSPLMGFKGDEYSESNKALVEHYKDLADWVRIGFSHEKDKGTLYADLQQAFDHIITQIAKTEEDSPTIQIEKKFMRFLKEAKCQISGAALGLELSATRQNMSQQVPDRHGNMLTIPLIQIYNRPRESHLMAAYKMREIGQNFDRYFAGEPIQTSASTLKLVP